MFGTECSPLLFENEIQMIEIIVRVQFRKLTDKMDRAQRTIGAWGVFIIISRFILPNGLRRRGSSASRTWDI